jgi:ABC-2 type transport system permease protein
MRHVGSIAGRELRGLFVSPVAYAVLSLFAVVAGFFFTLTVLAFSEAIFRYQQFQMFDQLSELNLNDHLIGQFYGSMGVIFLFAVPAITMGLFASEKTNGTQELLLTSPLTIWDIVLGKFLAAAIFVLLLGAIIGAFASSLTRSQIIAFLLTFVMLLVLYILPALSDLNVAGGSAGEFLRWLSTETHLEDLLKGLVDTQHLAYFAVMITAFLVLTKTSVESVRWR